MATIFSPLISPKPDSTVYPQMSPAIPGYTIPAQQTSYSTPSSSQQAAALKSYQQPVTTSPAAPAQSAPVTSYDFSQDAYSPAANVSGMTPEQMSNKAFQQMQDRVYAQAYGNPNTVITGAQTGVGQNFQAQYTPGGMTPEQAAWVAKYNQPEQTATPLTNEELLARFKPENVYSGGEYSVTNAGLTAPKKSDYTDTREYDQAVNQYNILKLEEQARIAQSPQAIYAAQQNAEAQALRTFQAKQNAAQAAVQEQDRVNALDRQALIRSLAARGLSAETDDAARQKLEEFDRNARNLSAAKAAEASLSLEDTRTAATNDAINRQKALADSLAQNIQSAIAALNTREKTALEYGKLSLAEKKALVEQAYKEGKISIQERDQAVKEAESAARVELMGAQTGKTEAESAYISGAKTEGTLADTAYTQARTKRVEELLPLEKAKMQAEVNKLLKAASGSGGGGAATSDAEWAKAYADLRQAGVEPTNANVAAAIKYNRVVSGGADLPTIQEAEMKGIADIAQTRGEINASFKPKTDASQFLNALVNQ